MRKTIHYIDMFAGIGGFREGLTRAGDFVCMGHCEIDKYADRSYRALFDTEGEWFILLDNICNSRARQLAVIPTPKQWHVRTFLGRNTIFRKVALQQFYCLLHQRNSANLSSLAM